MISYSSAIVIKIMKFFKREFAHIRILSEKCTLVSSVNLSKQSQTLFDDSKIFICATVSAFLVITVLCSYRV